jgi:Helix-turn-helix domain
MNKLSQLPSFQDRQNIVLKGFDPVSAGGFTQIPNAILRDKKLSVGAKLTYSILLSYAWHNNLVYPGQDTMAKEFMIGKRSIVRFLAELQKVGFLEIQRRGQGLTNCYVLRHSVKSVRK